MRKSIHDSLSEGDVLSVFPTEISARFWITDYVLADEQHAVLLDHVLAWDEFTKRFFFPMSKKPTNGTIRRLFAHQLLNEKQLRWFCYPDHSQSTQNIAADLTKLVSFLGIIQERRKKNPEAWRKLPEALRFDILTIEEAYQQFLFEHDLYEPLYEKPSRKAAKENNCFPARIFFPEVIDGWDEFLEALQTLDGIETYFSMQPSNPPLLTVFENELVELRFLMHRIETLLSDGVDPLDIVVSVGNLDQWKEYLVREATIRGIPLDIIEGVSVCTYPAGKFLSRLGDLASHQFSLDLMKEFLLDAHYPWKDRVVHGKLIERAVQLSIIHGSPSDREDEWEKKLGSSAQEGDQQLCLWYRRFKRAVIAITEASCAPAIISSLIAFEKEFFQEASWKASRADNDYAKTNDQVYGFCLERLEQLKQAMMLCGITAYNGLFSLYLQLLGQARYVSAVRRVGIPVYEYGISVALYPKYHFVVGCSHENTSLGTKNVPLVPEAVGHDFFSLGQAKDTLLLAHYSVLGETVFFSYGKQTFDGDAALAPTWFPEDRKIKTKQKNWEDIFQMEERCWAERHKPQFPLSQATARWFSQALSTAFQIPGIDIAQKKPSIPLFDRLSDDQGLVTITATALDQFISCPMKWACSALFLLEKKEYAVQMIDHALVGKVLHEILADFFRRLDERYGPFDPGKEELYRELLDVIMKDHIRRLTHAPHAPFLSTLLYMEHQYGRQLTQIIAAEGAVFADFRSIMFEHTVRQDYQKRRYRLHGRIDRILCCTREDGTEIIAVVDYKKTFSDNRKKYDDAQEELPSYQLPLYAKLFFDSRSQDVAIGAFYDIAKGKYHLIWKEDEKEHRDAMIEKLERKLDMMIESLVSGTLGAQPSKEHCTHCEFRQVCRRRYALP